MTNKTISKTWFRGIPKIIMFFSLLSFVVNLIITRYGLVSYKTGINIPITSFLIEKLNGKIILSFTIMLLLLTFQVLLISKKCRRTSEIAARFALDTMNQKMYDIDTRVNQGVISKSEGENLKDIVKKEIDFYSSMDGSSRFLNGVSKANVALVLVNFLGGMLVQKFRFNFPIEQAIKNAAVITAGNTVLFAIPIIVLGVFAGLVVKKSWK